MRLAVYAGSFDPVTFGHLDVVHRAAALFDRVVVAIGRHATKQPLFDNEQRMSLLREVTRNVPNVEIDEFDGLLIHYAKARRAVAIVRGFRAATDFEYELQIAHANADMQPEIDTVFLPTRVERGFVSASLVREIATHGGDVTRYVPPAVAAALSLRYVPAE
ncbi:MAG: pantetheine-phosphate adenylyltransferase [Myxococcales bacterium]|nr:pantetheine-phosphate adenylyltransferase [Myxococcales bacterium]